MILSIIIPVYNVERFVGKTLDSIYSQRSYLSNVEVVVVNDGTPDNSMTIVDGYRGLIPNLVIINQKNSGLSNARNTGLTNASGNFIWFVDSDDWIEKDSIKHIKEKLCSDNKRTDVFCYKIREYNEKGIILGEKHFPFKTEISLTGCEFMQSSISFAPMQQFVIRKSFLSANGLFFVNGLIHEDIEFAPKMLLKTENVCVVPEVSYCYLRRSGDNITGSKKSINEKRLNSLLFILKEYIDLEKTAHSRQVLKAIKRVQRISTYAIYNFASIEQIKTNYMSAYKGENVRIYKKVILRSMLYYNEKYSHFILDMAFLISPTFYKRLTNKDFF